MPTRSYHISTVILTLTLVACSVEAEPVTIDRDTFVHTYANLRIAAVETDSGRIAFDVRDSILEAFEVTEEDLTRFAEVHADNLEFMRDVWNDVELLMDRGESVN